MDSLFETVFTLEVMITALVVGGAQEALKQVVVAIGVRKGAAFKTVMAVAPMVSGGLLGLVVIPDGGVAPPAVLGMVAGMFASQVYNTVAPTARKAIAAVKKKDKDGE